MDKRRQYRKLPDAELGPDLDEQVRFMTELADRDVEETRVNFRWGRRQLAIVKQAAATLGVPYQTYLKQVVFRQAVADICGVEGIEDRSVEPRPAPSSRSPAVGASRNRSPRPDD